MESEKPSLLVVSGFGDKGISELADTLSLTDAFSRTEVMRGCPWWHAMTDPHNRVNKIEEQLAQMREMGEQVMLVGHSYGAFLSLAAACRRRLAGICGVFINGPLNPYISVLPPQGKPLFHLFARHYRMREKIARECMSVLLRVDNEVLGNFVTVTSPNDSIVTPEAQELRYIFPSIAIPREIRGHGMSRAKIAAVSEIITDMMRNRAVSRRHYV